MPNEKIRPPTTSNNSLSPKQKLHKSNKVGFKSICLKQDKITFTPDNVVNLFIICELYRWPQDLNPSFTLKDCLFGAVKSTKDSDEYSYPRNDI